MGWQFVVWCWIAWVLVLLGIGMHQRMPLASVVCDQYAQQHDEGQEPPNYDCAAFDRFVLQPVVDGLGATGEFVERRHDALIAFGTLVIAAFTGTLWWSTRSQLRHLGQALGLVHPDTVDSDDEYED